MMLSRLRRSKEAPEDDNVGSSAPTRRTFGAVRRWFQRSALSAADWDALEEILISADLGPRLSMELIEELRDTVNADGSVDATRAHEVMIEHLGVAITNDDAEFASGHPPQVIFVVGVNGVGKTTSIAKLAYMLRGLGHEVLLAAGDTFRAWPKLCEAPQHNKTSILLRKTTSFKNRMSPWTAHNKNLR